MEISGLIKECKRAEKKLNYTKEKTETLKQLAKDVKDGKLTQEQAKYKMNNLSNTVVDFGGVFENLSFYLNNKTKKISLVFLKEKDLSFLFNFKKKEELKGNIVLDVIIYENIINIKNIKKIKEVIKNKIDLCDEIVLFNLEKNEIPELNYIEEQNKKMIFKK